MIVEIRWYIIKCEICSKVVRLYLPINERDVIAALTPKLKDLGWGVGIWADHWYCDEHSEEYAAPE